MIKEIVKDQFILSQVSREATIEDMQVVQDLEDTLNANRDRCVGLAANMIGSLVRIAVILERGMMNTFINPRILSCSGKYKTEEGCLSLTGVRETFRYEKIKVEYQDKLLRKRIRTLTGYEAQILQHEMDHFDGILI